MKTITLFDQQTGEIKRVLTLPEKAIAANVPDSCGFKVGRFDKFSQRVDIATGDVIEHRDEALNAARQREMRERDARRRIAALEQAQARPMRELAIDPNNDAAKQRLAAIDSEIAERRKDLQP